MTMGTRVFFAMVAATAVAAAVHAATPPKKADGEKVICRVVPQLGSHLAEKRVCLTRDQWRQQKDMERQDMDKMRIRTGPDGG